ncbi:MAG: hypothetical protein FWH57_07315 [Oscillospiraceae bacterium]|nr:hypothetical protein [Oscillospiraceae bacterium]
MYDYDSVKYIEVLNYYLGMDHRTESFDLSKTEDLKQALELAVGAYRDYFHYESTLAEMVEDFDESLEHFDTITWVNMTRAHKKTDSLAVACAASLSTAYNNFVDFSDKARDYLSVLLKIILTAPNATQEEILGDAYNISPKEINNLLEELYDSLSDAEYKYAIPDNLKVFLEVLKEQWADLALPKS